MKRLNQNPTILEANYFYLFAALVFVTLGSLAQRWDFNIGVLITEYGIILLPTILFIKIRGYSLKKVLRLNKLSIKQIFLIPLIAITAYPIAVFGNLLMIIILTMLGKVKPMPIPIPETGGEYALLLFLIAISAGICEEVMFRGLMQKSYERLGKRKAIVISAIMFGVFHLNLQNLFGPIILGLLFGYILYKTNSIFATMLAHATNNAFALTLGVLMKKLLDYLNKSQGFNQSMSQDALNNVPKEAQLVSLIVWLIVIAAVAILCGLLLYLLLKALPNKDEKDKEELLIKDKDVKIKEYLGQMSRGKKIAIVLPMILVTILFIYQGYLFMTL